PLSIIEVRKGRYTESVTINKTLCLRSTDGAGNAIIDGNGDGGISIVSDATMDGFTVTNSTGLVIGTCDALVTNCVFRDNTAGTVIAKHVGDDWWTDRHT